MLTVENVSKKYGKVLANNNISLSIDDGQIAILMGPNGAGKSTLIKSIVGLLRYQGNILINNYPNKSIEAKRLLGYVPELPALYDMLTVSEHIEFITRAYKIKDDGYGDELLKRFELDDKKDKLGRELSKGMQQKLSIICALVHKPKLIIFDEPMIGLDPHAIKELKEIYMDLKKQGCSLLISTHLIDSVKEIWDIVHIVKDGSIATTRVRSEEEAADESLEDLFFRITEGK